MTPRRRSSAFTMIEFMLVVTISGILIVGLAAIVEAPQVMLEKQVSQATVSSADRMLSQLDEDVRFATDVRTPNPRRLEVDLRTGETIVYEWDGSPGGNISRTTPGGTATLQGKVHDTRFDIETVEVETAPEDTVTTEINRIAGSWDGTFQLKPGFRMVGSPFIIGTTEVTMNMWYCGIKEKAPGGIVFQATGLTGDATITNLNLKLRRANEGEVRIYVYKALGVTGSDSDRPVPDTTDLYASYESLISSNLPLNFDYHDFPMTTHKKIQNGAWYFIQIGGWNANRVTYELAFRTVDPPAGAREISSCFYRSPDDWGSSFDPVESDPDGGQCMFTLDVVESEVSGGAGGSTVTIPVAVHFNLQLNATGAEGESLTTSVPIQNNCELVNQMGS